MKAATKIPREGFHSPLDQYLREIGTIPVLDHRTESELGHRIRAGDRRAMNELVRHNLRFVVLIARRYAGRGVPIEDLIEEGNIGLIQAAERFDERFGHRFITYAVYWIRRAMIAQLNQWATLVHLPTRTKRQLGRLARAAACLPHQLGREPHVEEIAAWSGIEVDRIEELRRVPVKQLSLDCPANGSEAEFETDTLADPHALAFEARLEMDLDASRVHSALFQIDPRSADIIRRYCGLHGDLPESLDTIGRHYGISGERARQIRDRGMQRLRQVLEHERAQRRNNGGDSRLPGALSGDGLAVSCAE